MSYCCPASQEAFDLKLWEVESDFKLYTAGHPRPLVYCPWCGRKLPVIEFVKEEEE